ncbi:MAG: hypothetical protein QXF08_05855, partial [Nitrososphaerota archaeon]
RSDSLIKLRMKGNKIANIIALIIMLMNISMPVALKIPCLVSLPAIIHAIPTIISPTRFTNGMNINIYPIPPSHL